MDRFINGIARVRLCIDILVRKKSLVNFSLVTNQSEPRIKWAFVKKTCESLDI